MYRFMDNTNDSIKDSMKVINSWKIEILMKGNSGKVFNKKWGFLGLLIRVALLLLKNVLMYLQQ